MKEYIKFEVLRNLKRKEVKLLIFILFMCEIILMLSMNNQSKNEEVYKGSSDWVATTAYFADRGPKELLDKVEEDMKNLENNLILYDKYEQDQDWKNMYWQAMEYNSYYAQLFSFYPIDDIEYYINKNIVKEIQKKYNLKSIENYGKIIGEKDFDAYDIFSWPLHDLRYFTELYEKDLKPLKYSSIDSCTVLIQILRNILAYVTPILVMLLFYNDRKEYHEMGVDKTMMVISKARSKYVLGKIMANTIIMLIVTCGPILIFTLVLGVFDHFQNFIYPCFANKDGIFGIQYSYFNKLTMGETLQQTLETNTMINFGVTYTSANMLLNPHMDFIPLWQGILFTFILYVCLIVLYVQINMLITRLIKNPYLAMVVNIGIILLLILISPLPSMNFMNTFNPLTYRDPGMNVMGTSYFPWSAGMLVVLVYNIILYVCNKIVFARKYYG